MRDKFVKYWCKMPLRRKLQVIIVSVGLIMEAVVLVNLNIPYSFIDNVRIIMDDNLVCYRFQDALDNEKDLFIKFMSGKNQETEEKFRRACEETAEFLEELPYDYVKIGEERYSITWNIKNAYEEYAKQRDKVITMDRKEEEYITELYKTYKMQDYLSAYASRLTKAVLLEGNGYYEEQLPILKQMPYILLLISFAAFWLLLAVMRLFMSSILKIVGRLAEASGKIEKNDFSGKDLEWKGQDEIGQLVSAFNKMKHSTQNYVVATEEKRVMEERLYRQELERAELEQRFSMAQLQLIRSQLNPHFLFNTLNMITRMAQMEEAPITEEMLVAMSNLLRYSLRTTNAFAPLKQELKVVQDYMYIQRMRFGERVSFFVVCPEELHAEEVPVFLLQPLVENAVLHGIADKETGGIISIGIMREEETLRITVEDTGEGMSEEHLKRVREEAEKRGTGLGIGLGNIHRRIEAYYEKGSISINSRAGVGTVIQIEFGKRKV
ncbi:MAG: sensor histidine kinase [Lachnospiraceae bacterium]